MKYACAVCRGRGFVMRDGRASTWPAQCSICQGRRGLSSRELGQLTKLDGRTVDRIDKGTARASSAAQFIEAIPMGVLQEAHAAN